MISIHSKKKSGDSFKCGLAFLEITVVVAIVIAGIIIVSTGFGEIQKRARDSKRISDIRQIEKALGLYFASTTRFPVIQKETIIDGSDSFSSVVRGEFTGEKVPVDPLYPEYAYSYISNSDGSDYRIKFCLETETISEFKKGCDNVVNP